MQDFRKLHVCHKSHKLVLELYARTATFPRNELFRVTAQARRAAVSIAANIAEVSARSGDKEFAFSTFRPVPQVSSSTSQFSSRIWVC